MGYERFCGSVHHGSLHRSVQNALTVSYTACLQLASLLSSKHRVIPMCVGGRTAAYRMCRLVVPPMNGGQLRMELHACVLEHFACTTKQLVCMLQQQAAVPLQEEAPVLAVPAALVMKEACLVGPLAVAACIMRAAVAPVGLAYLLRCC